MRKADIKEGAKDWRVVVNDTGDVESGWPSVCSDDEDRCVLHVNGFKQEHWPAIPEHGPTMREAMAIAHLVADFMNGRCDASDLREENERLREALKPFAAYYRGLTRVKRGNVPRSGCLWALDTGTEHETEITVEDLARAAELVG